MKIVAMGVRMHSGRSRTGCVDSFGYAQKGVARSTQTQIYGCNDESGEVDVTKRYPNLFCGLGPPHHRPMPLRRRDGRARSQRTAVSWLLLRLGMSIRSGATRISQRRRYGLNSAGSVRLSAVFRYIIAPVREGSNNRPRHKRKSSKIR